MRTALARHDALLRQAIEANAGVVFKTIGDAFCAAFATAPQALAAALIAQGSLLSEPWPFVLKVGRRENLFQLHHPTLPSDFPPLRTLDSLPTNLPLQLTSFIDREKELAESKMLIANTRLLTFAGSGGSGKTGLSLQSGAEALDEYAYGVWLAELAPLTEPGLLASTVAQALGIKEMPGQALQQCLLESLKNKSLLLILDNCEHFLSACAQLAAVLLRSCPHVKVLATSREALGIGGEQTYRVPSLTAPDLKQKATPESLSQYEAVQVFIDRAYFHKPDFAVTNANAPTLAQLCHRLDGIPLAIELAAARVALSAGGGDQYASG